MASRRKRRASTVLESPPGVRPGGVPSWRAVVRRPAFLASAVRQALPVVGVFFLGWPAIDVAAFFLLEVWLFITLRFAVEVTLDRPQARDLPARRLVSDFLKHLLAAAIGMALLVGMMALVSVATTFPRGDLVAFALRGWRSPSFLAALAFMVSSLSWEAHEFAGRCAGRSDGEREADNVRLRVVFARLLVVALSGTVLGLAQALGVGGQALVLVIAGAIVWLDATPERAEKLLGFEPRRAA
jgi:hypothetical protein